MPKKPDFENTKRHNVDNRAVRQSGHCYFFLPLAAGGGVVTMPPVTAAVTKFALSTPAVELLGLIMARIKAALSARARAAGSAGGAFFLAASAVVENEAASTTASRAAVL